MFYFVNKSEHRFKLGNKRGAEMYINQFQELFSEDGRRNVTVSNVSLNKDK